MRKMKWSYRWHHALGWTACLALMAYALFAQHVLRLEPCPLCIFQRIAVMGMGLGFFIAWAWAPISRAGRIVATAGVVVPALAGIGVAGRHVWLQRLPPSEVPACGPGLDFMLGAFPLKDVIERVLTGEDPRQLAGALTQLIEPLAFADTSRRGYMVVTATPAECCCDWVFVSTVLSREYEVVPGPSWRTLPRAGQRRLMPA